MSATTNKYKGSAMGVLGRAVNLAPLAILMLVASQFPYMIDRRIQVKKSQERLAQSGHSTLSTMRLTFVGRKSATKTQV